MRRFGLLIISILFILTISGCEAGVTQASQSMPTHVPSEAPITTTTALLTPTPTTAPSDTTAPTPANESSILNMEDFNINYKGVLINDSVPFRTIADSLNITVGSDEGNSELRASVSVGKIDYRWIIVHYPSEENEEIRIQYVINDTLKTEYLVYVDLFKAETNRGIKVGDDLKQLLDVYGNVVEPDYNSGTTDYYQYNLYDNPSESNLDKFISIVVDKEIKKITEISINYNNDKAMIELEIPSFE